MSHHQCYCGWEAEPKAPIMEGDRSRLIRGVHMLSESVISVTSPSMTVEVDGWSWVRCMLGMRLFMGKLKGWEAKVFDMWSSETMHTGGMPDTMGLMQRVCTGMLATFWLLWLKYLKETTWRRGKIFFWGAGAQLGWSCLNAPCARVKLTEVGIHGRDSSSLPVQNVRRIQGQGPHSPRTHLQSPNFSSYILPSEVSKTSPNSTISLEPIISKQLCYLISTHN